jgi:hypothetical protein
MEPKNNTEHFYSFLPSCTVTGQVMEISLYVLFHSVLYTSAVNFLSQNLEIKSCDSNSFRIITPFFCIILPCKVRFLECNLHRFF